MPVSAYSFRKILFGAPFWLAEAVTHSSVQYLRLNMWWRSTLLLLLLSVPQSRGSAEDEAVPRMLQLFQQAVAYDGTLPLTELPFDLAGEGGGQSPAAGGSSSSAWSVEFAVREAAPAVPLTEPARSFDAAFDSVGAALIEGRFGEAGAGLHALCERAAAAAAAAASRSGGADADARRLVSRPRAFESGSPRFAEIARV